MLLFEVQVCIQYVLGVTVILLLFVVVVVVVVGLMPRYCIKTNIYNTKHNIT